MLSQEKKNTIIAVFTGCLFETTSWTLLFKIVSVSPSSATKFIKSSFVRMFKTRFFSSTTGRHEMFLPKKVTVALCTVAVNGTLITVSHVPMRKWSRVAVMQLGNGSNAIWKIQENIRISTQKTSSNYEQSSSYQINSMFRLSVIILRIIRFEMLDQITYFCNAWSIIFLLRKNSALPVSAES